MQVLIVFIFVGLLASSSASVVMTFQGVREADRASYRKAAFQRVIDAASVFYEEDGSYPASLAVLASDERFSYLRDQPESLVLAYRVSPMLTDAASSIQFRRAGLVLQELGRIQDEAGLFVSNGCPPTAGQTFDNGLQWCGPPQTPWAVFDERAPAGRRQAQQEARLQRMLKRFVAWHDANGLSFPDPGSTTEQELKTLVGASAVTVNNCTGVWAWQGIPFSCDELMSGGGEPVTYTRISAKRVRLRVQIQDVDASGNAISVSANADLS